MSTRSMIVMEQEDGEYLGIYCHCDGYLTHNGAILVDHYSEREKVAKLISFGDLSYLAPSVNPSIEKPHSFDKPQRGVCIFYGRDRGETSTEATVLNLRELEEDPWIEYTYVFGLDNKWKYFEYKGLDSGLKSADGELDKIFKEWNFIRPEGVYGWYTKSDIAALQTRKDRQVEEEKQIEKPIENVS